MIAKGSYDPGSRRYTLTLNQSTPATPGQPSKRPLHIPIRFGLVGTNGGDLSFDAVSGGAVTGDIIHLTKAGKKLVFDGVTERPVPSLLHGFSAPVSLSVDLSATDLSFLLRADSDPFNRWRAAQTLSMRALVAATAAIRDVRRTSAQSELIAALGSIATDDTLDPSLRSQILTLPTETEVAREIGRDVDPDAIASARDNLRAELGRRHAADLRRLYDELTDDGPYRPDANSQGQRALRNTALDLLFAGDSAFAATERRQFELASNMTDRMAALGVLNRRAGSERDEALAAFRQRYSADPLVLDKWLALEATAPNPNAVDRVATLMDDPSFSIDNPNRLRALIGSFAAANQTQFNRPDGAGYELVADVVMQLDGKNPQVAARLLVSFRSWRSLEQSRRTAAERALRRIASAKSPSPDVNDIITRILA